MTDPATLVNHLRAHTAPAVDAAGRQLAARLSLAPPKLPSRVLDAAHQLATVDLLALAGHLAEQRTLAAEGRPRQGISRRGNGVSNPTMDTGAEMARIRGVGIDVAWAIEELVLTSMRAVDRVAGESWGTLSPAQSWDDLHDTVDVLRDAAREAVRLVHIAFGVRAWARDPAEVDPPVDRGICSGWPKEAACGQLVSVHHHPETGSVHLTDVCDSCYRLVCRSCWAKPSRRAGSDQCEACYRRALRKAGQAA